MKADIKLCASSFSVVTFPTFFSTRSWSSSKVHVCSIRQLKRCFPWSREITFCGWQNWNPTPMFDACSIRCTHTKQCGLTDLLCVMMSIWERQEVSCNNTGCHAACVPGQCQIHKAFQKNSLKFTIMPTVLNFLLCFVQNTETACLKAAVGPIDEHAKIMIQETSLL